MRDVEDEVRPGAFRGACAALALGLGVAFVVPAPSAVGELLRCEGPDGGTIFTDDPARCPGAETYEPRATLQSAPGAAGGDGAAAEASPSAAARRRDLADDARRGEAERWARKKREAEEAIEQVAARREYLRQYVTHCNRGGDVLTRDASGIKRTVDCDSLRESFAELDAREAELRAYLDEGLAEECRRAGCLPGWIR